jgi:hypothetical protein
MRPIVLSRLPAVPVVGSVLGSVLGALLGALIGVGASVLAFVPLLLATGCLFGGCVDAPVIEPEPPSRIVAVWDPLACGDPHRVVVELEDDDGARASTSVPCELGGATLDLRHWGVYRGRIYAWTLGPTIRSVVPVRLDVDAEIIHWYVETPR